MATIALAKKYGVLVVDDHPVVLAGLSQIINAEPDLTCCGSAETFAAARESFYQCKPDVVTIDLSLPDGDGVELIKELAAANPSVPILAVSQFDETVYAERVLKAGARGYIMKERCPEDIIHAIHSIIAGELSVSCKVAALALHQLAGRKGQDHPLDVLTNRELQIFQLLGGGIGSRAIAEKLKLSIKTVETHRENIKQKLGLRDAAALIHCATNWVQTQGSTRHQVGEKPIKYR